MRKALSLVAVAAVISGLLVAVAPPAMAAQPAAVENFHPNESFSPSPAGESDTVSDRDDGQGVGAHLTSVATEDTERVIWYHCANATFTPGGGNPLTQSELNDNAQCRLINSDLTPRKPSGASGVVTDEAYDIVWDIPSEFDRQRRDLVGVACIGAGTQIEPFGFPSTAPNCTMDIEDGVSLDDSSTTQATAPTQTAAEQTSAGEITQVCLADQKGGPGDTNGNRTAPDEDTFAEDPCEVDPAGTDVAASGSTERAAIDARFAAFPHGFAVPDIGFVFRATTDPSIAEGGGSLFWAMTSGDANSLGLSSSGTVGPCTNLSGVTGTNLLWECIVPDSAVTAGQEKALGILDQVTTTSPSPGAGYCDFTEAPETSGDPSTHDDPDGFDGGCQLDVHYLSVVSSQLASVSASFQPGGGVATNAGCDTGEVPDRDETDRIEAGSDPAANIGRELVVVCFTDQTGQPVVNRSVTFESTGPDGSGIFGCVPDERTNAADVQSQGQNGLHDHDGNGRSEHCHTITGSTGEATALINNISSGSITAEAGNQTVLVCDDPEVQLAVGPTQQPAEHGCLQANGDPLPAERRSSVIARWVVLPNHVHLVFANTGTTADPCHSGERVKEFTVGQTGTLMACVFDANDRPATTTQTNGGRLSWGYTAPTNTAAPSSSIGAQPSETDSGARASVTFTAIRTGSDFVTVSLENDDGSLQCPTTDTARCRATVEIRVVAAPPTTSPSPSVSPSQSTTAARQTRSVNLESSSTAVDPGASFVLSGNIVASDPTCYAAQTVTIVRTPIGGGAEETVGTLTSASDGVFSGTFSGKAGVYTARLAETVACSAATSSTVTLKEKVVLALTTSRSRIRAGRRVRITTTLTPCAGHSGTPVAFFASTSGGGFSQISEKTLNSSCSASLTKRLRRSRTFQTRWAADNDHAAGVSPTRRVRVRRTGDTSGGGGGF